ncbi:hypothetical protein CNMCM6069_000616 [Aspergillus lentulus]|nr:hypothetical protein CNMCM6069_000616 [Aspergillus lentulus]KAF4173714.1 hypothetical protein CNMCM8060_009600 [Aspergillus lentulus]KAF4181474.1 hypothetical protein CNMCM7927_000631 [Aspergillus lentulus]KAF4195370.1 hypothetical protein CNMCM8694_006424 [Aspergillus lentulus]
MPSSLSPHVPRTVICEYGTATGAIQHHGRAADQCGSVIIAADSPLHIRPIRQRLRPNRRASNCGPSGIDVSLTDDRFNVGQKRLLFLARVTVRAGVDPYSRRGTASVDWETNQLVQKISREDFADSASITVRGGGRVAGAQPVARARSPQFILGLYNSSTLYMAVI